MLRQFRYLFLIVFAAQLVAWSVYAAETADPDSTAEVGEAVPEVDQPSVLQVLQSTPGYGLFGNLIRLAGNPEIFSDGGPMTVFVPADGVLLKEFNAYMAGAEGEAYQKRLRKLVLSHVLREQYTQDDMRYNLSMTGGRQHLQTASGDAVTLRLDDNRILVQDERGNKVPIDTSIVAEDGVVHGLVGAMLKAR